jgi:hypothetical protein
VSVVAEKFSHKGERASSSYGGLEVGSGITGGRSERHCEESCEALSSMRVTIVR